MCEYWTPLVGWVIWYVLIAISGFNDFLFVRQNFHKQFSCHSKIDDHRSLFYLSETLNVHRFDGTEIVSSHWNNSINVECVFSNNGIEVSVSLGRIYHLHLLYSTIYHTKRNFFFEFRFSYSFRKSDAK